MRFTRQGQGSLPLLRCVKSLALGHHGIFDELSKIPVNRKNKYLTIKNSLTKYRSSVCSIYKKIHQGSDA